MEAHIDDVSLGTNTQEDHVLLLREFFIVCQENHLRIKLEKCEFMKEEMEYLGFDVGYGWWKPAVSKMQPLQDMQIGDDPKKGLHDVRSFVGACNFYWRHIHNFSFLEMNDFELVFLETYPSFPSNNPKMHPKCNHKRRQKHTTCSTKSRE